MNIAISSGKGGTGKTFIATNLAILLAEQDRAVTYIDCDVEEPNGHLFLKPEIARTERVTVRAPLRIDPETCIGCGRCAEACHYNAIAVIKDKALLFPELCHACGACGLVCPVGAVIEGDKEIGELHHGTSGPVDFHYGLLKTAVGGMSPRLIEHLKTFAGTDITLLDSPPGTACSTVETVKGADLCLLVADPTPFALHDLKLSVNMCRQIGQEPAVVVNRAGLDDTDLKEYCRRAELEIVGEIPDDRRIAEVYSVGDMVVEQLPEYREHFGRLLEAALDLAGKPREARLDLIEPLFTPGGQTARAKAPGPGGRRPEEIVVISGKGGTGKTSIAACYAQLASGSVVADCDVDAADLHLVLNPEVQEEGDFVGGVSVEIDQARCTQCGRCMEACRFSAIERTEDGRYLVDPTACEGCGVCQIVCPADAVESEDAVNGKWFVSTTRFGPMAHAILGHAEENSGRLVTVVRDLACDLTAELERGADAAGAAGERVQIDGSPGTGCPVIASVSGARYAVVVAEPTVSGLHDLLRVLDLTRHFGVPSGVIVNKADLNDDMTERIEAAAREAGAEMLGTIPYDPGFTDAQIRRKTLLEHGESPAAETVRATWKKIAESVQAASSA
jgi:MinD superfamily P-loop ATPase